MFGAIQRAIFQAKVQAELMGQHGDQKFVNSLCHRDEYIEYIHFMRTNAYFKGAKIAPFMVVCGLLGEAMNNPELDDEERKLCAILLAQRLNKVSSNEQFRLRHLLIFGKLEEMLREWGRKHNVTLT